MGMSERAVRALVPLDSIGGKKGFFKAARVPKPHSAFESYTLAISPKQGLCKVVAIGVDIRTSVYGAELVSQFDAIEQMVTEKYGRAQRHDFLRSGSIWNEPRDWMMGLLKKERALTTFWTREEIPALPPALGAIELEANALSSEKGYLILSFEFANFDVCSAELKTNPF
jgi:hypothetical protein